MACIVWTRTPELSNPRELHLYRRRAESRGGLVKRDDVVSTSELAEREHLGQALYVDLPPLFPPATLYASPRRQAVVGALTLAYLSCPGIMQAGSFETWYTIK